MSVLLLCYIITGEILLRYMEIIMRLSTDAAGHQLTNCDYRFLITMTKMSVVFESLQPFTSSIESLVSTIISRRRLHADSLL